MKKELKNSNFRGTSLACAAGICLVMYADDIALIADTSVELQRNYTKSSGVILSKVGNASEPGQNKGNHVYERWKGFFKRKERKVFVQVEDN